MRPRSTGLSTVRGHLERLISKLGVSDRTQAAVRIRCNQTVRGRSVPSIEKSTGALDDPGPLEGTIVELTRYLIVKYQDFMPTFLAASVATIFTVFLPLASLGEL